MKLIEKMNSASSILIEDVKKIEGDIAILGVSGKIGYNLASKLMDALKKAGKSNKVYGVARFSDGVETMKKFEEIGVIPIKSDLMDTESLNNLPNVPNVIFMAGYKFGTTGNEGFTWAMNSYLPGKVAERFKDSNIVVFSTGCVYPLVSVSEQAPSEEDSVDPMGEYAQSCLGRERIFEYYSKKNGTKIVIFRLNYAIDLTYGVLVELAQTIKEGLPVNLSMGFVNVIWQPDVSEMAIRSLLHVSSPANILNITGPETLSVRWISQRLAEVMDMPVTFEGIENESALLSNASKSHALFGYPSVSIREMIDYVGHWIKNDGITQDKPTHFQERDGKY